MRALTEAVDRIPVRRIRRAAASRLSGLAGRLTGMLDGEQKLICNACGAPTAQYVLYAGKPNLCPSCGSSAKERLLLALLDDYVLEVPARGRFLHLAPSEWFVAERLSAAGEYIAADLNPSSYAGLDVKKLDLAQLPGRVDELGRFDRIYASHVLEHVPDDRAALEGIRKSLRVGGEFWMLVPLTDGPTIDGLGGETVREREERFGQWDHVRQYGLDVADRLAEVGFEVEQLSIADVEPEVIFSAGLAADDVVWKCTAGG